MSGMHLLPIYYSTTSQKKRKSRKVTASMQKALDDHEKYLAKVGYRGKSYSISVTPSPKIPTIPQEPKIPSVGEGIGNGFKKTTPVYNGNAIIGQAYNKGGLQVLSASEAKDPSTGKRR